MIVPKFFDESVDTLLEIEHVVASEAALPFYKILRRVLTLLHAIWPGDDASDAEKQMALARLDLEAFLAPMSGVEGVILQGAITALGQGIKAGIAEAGLTKSAIATTFKHTLPDSLVLQGRAVGVTMRRRVIAGMALLTQARTLLDAEAAIAVANPSTAVQAQSRWLTNRASNEGLVRVAEADSHRSVLVWRAERDACVHCLAYQGQVRTRGHYPAGLTFGKKPLHRNPVSMPPLHPNCRCTQWVLSRDVANPVIEGLKREAKRSILRGWSVESESEAVRVDAARRLLAQRPTLPKSVQTYARQSVKAGRFKRGRTVPA